MPAEALKQFRHGVERLKKVHPLDRPPRAHAHPVFRGKEDDRLGVALHQAGSDDADDAVVPPLAHEQNGAVAHHIGFAGGDFLARVGKDLRFYGLAVFVFCIQLRRQRQRRFPIVGQKRSSAVCTEPVRPAALMRRCNGKADGLGLDLSA